MDLLAKQHTGKLSLKEISSILQFPKPTALRFLNSLEKHGFVEKDSSGNYQLGLRLFYLGNFILRGKGVRDVASPFIREIRDKTHEGVHLNIIYEDKCLVVDAVEGLHDLKAMVHVGQTCPLYVGASGKAILAFCASAYLTKIIAKLKPVTEGRPGVDKTKLLAELDQIREQGWAVSDGEQIEGVITISAPIKNHTYDVIASLSLTAPEVRIKEGKLEEYIKIIVDGSLEISKQMGMH